MSRVLTQDQMQDMLSRPQQGLSQTNSALTPTPTPPEGICLSNRPRMPRGWLNSAEGHSWMQKRAEAFSNMDAGGRMNFGFLPKNKDK